MNKVVKNASWLIACKVVQLVLSLLLTMLTARYLGPSQYGILNYAISVTSFFLPIALLGMNSVLVQEYVMHPEDTNKIIGTSLVLSILSSTICILGVFLFTLIVNVGDVETQIVCVIYSIMMLTQGVELIEYWFQSQLLAKYISIVSLIAYFVISIYKVTLLIKGAGVKYFALSYSLDYLMIGVALFYIFLKKYKNGNLSFSWEIARRIVNKSKFYIISTLMVTLFAQQDKIMIKMLLDDTNTGYYSAAVSCATMSGFLFVSIIDSMRPVIFNSLKESEDKFEKKIIRLYSIICLLCILQGLVCTLFAKYIVLILFGKEYFPTIKVLQIIIWYSAFSYIGGIRDIWLLAKNKQNYLIVINFIGALTNALLNIVLIKWLGINGAAIASLITQIFTNVGLTALIKPIRRNNYLIKESLKPKYMITMLKGIRKSGLKNN